MGIHKKKFMDLKTFPEWLKWKQEDKKSDRVIAVLMLLILIPTLTYLIGFAQGYALVDNNIESVACSAIGMEHVSRTYNDYCVDEQGNFHEIVINKGKAYIENNSKEA